MIATSARNGLVQRCKGGLFAALIGLGAHAADRVIAGTSLQRRAFGPEVRHFGRTTKGGLFAALIGRVNRLAKDGLCRQSGAQSIRAAP